MTEEVQPVAGLENPVATPEPTVGSETVSDVPPETSGEPETHEPEAEKTFTQKELDEIIAKRVAKEQRKAQREADRRIAAALQEQPKQPQVQAEGRPKPENFTSTEDYVEAVADWKASERIRTELEAREKASNEARQREEVSKVHSEFLSREDEVREKYDDYDKVAYQTPYECTPAMAQVIQWSEMGPELAYYLGKHPDEASRIAQIRNPLVAAKELGKLEDKISASPSVQKTSSAPTPIKPVTSKSSIPVRDTTDPRSDSLSTKEWIRLENERERKKLAAKGYR